MKKILTIVSVLAVMVLGSSAFAEMNLAFHFGHDFSNFVWDVNSSDVSETNFGLTALKVTDKNLALKWDVEAGAVHGDSLFNKDGGGGGAWFSFGVGKALARNEKMTLTLMPVLGAGFIMSSYRLDGADAKSKDKYEENFLGVRMGVDFTGIFRLTKVLGIFTNLGLYYTVGSVQFESKISTLSTEFYRSYEETETTDSYLLNGWTFAPSIGVSLTFGN